MDVRRKIIFFVGQHIRFVNSVLEKYNFLPSGDPIRIFPKKIKVKTKRNLKDLFLKFKVKLQSPKT